MRISIELVPRSADAFVNDGRAVRESFPWVSMLNYPVALPHLREVLVVTGDAPDDMRHVVYPIFDLRLVELYAEMLESRTVFWGASPVTSGAARAYWETRNNAFFPTGFRPALE